MTSPPDTDRAQSLLGKRDAFEGVARWLWMASGMGTDEARSTSTNRPQPQAQRVVEKVGRSITNSETPHHDHDRSPVKVTARHTGEQLDLGFYSRLRKINTASSYSVNG